LDNSHRLAMARPSPPTMAIGARRIGALSVGDIKENGKGLWKSLLINWVMNGS